MSVSLSYIVLSGIAAVVSARERFGATRDLADAGYGGEMPTGYGGDEATGLDPIAEDEPDTSGASAFLIGGLAAAGVVAAVAAAAVGVAYKKAAVSGAAASAPAAAATL